MANIFEDTCGRGCNLALVAEAYIVGNDLNHLCHVCGEFVGDCEVSTCEGDSEFIDEINAGIVLA